MSVRMRFVELALTTESGRHPYRFRPGVNVIAGPVGVGKSSLFELCKYALGGRGVLTWAVHQAVQRVSLSLSIGGGDYLFVRDIGTASKSVEFRDGRDGSLIETCDVEPRGERQWISDVLLGLLERPARRIVRATNRPAAETVAISFNDIYRYLYVPQAEIDRSVVRHLDRTLHRKRLATFELLYDLADDRLIDLEISRAELREQLTAARVEVANVATFLQHTNAPAEEELRFEQFRLAAEAETISRRLRALREHVRESTHFADASRQDLAALKEELRDLRDQLEAVSFEIQRHQALIAQLELDRVRVARSSSATAVLQQIRFQVCPRCQQDLEHRPSEPGHCYVCGLPEPEEVPDLDLEAEHKRLTAQLEETRALLDEDERRYRTLRQRAADLEAAIDAEQAQLDERTREYVSPRFDEIESVSARNAELRVRQDAVDRALQQWEQYRRLERVLAELQGELRSVERLLRDARVQLEARRERVVELSDLFDELLRFFRLPWYESARIDRRSYLPVVNGQNPEDLLSGGMRTIVNDAYHLAGLTYTLTHPTLLPPLLIIDSPRKNLGSGPDDTAISFQIYRHFQRLAGAYGDNFQLIVADNDVPPAMRDLTSFTLDYDHPLIPDVQHPGEGRVETITKIEP